MGPFFGPASAHAGPPSPARSHVSGRPRPDPPSTGGVAGGSAEEVGGDGAGEAPVSGQHSPDGGAGREAAEATPPLLTWIAAGVFIESALRPHGRKDQHRH